MDFSFKDFSIKFDNNLEKIKYLPKVDLHRNLTGSIRSKTIVDIANKNNIKLSSLFKIEKYIQPTIPGITSFSDYMKPWNKIKYINLILKDPEDYYQITYEAIEDAYHDNIRYLELRVHPHGLFDNKYDSFKNLNAIIKSIDDANTNLNIITKLIISLPRHFIGSKIIFKGVKFLNNYTDNLLQIAQIYKDKYIVGVHSHSMYNCTNIISLKNF